MDKPETPTAGGSYVRQNGGELKKVEGTAPAPEPVNRKPALSEAEGSPATTETEEQ